MALNNYLFLIVFEDKSQLFLSDGLVKRGLCIAFLALIILPTGITLVAGNTSVSQLGGMPVVGPVVPIQVPLLTKSVIFDGSVTYSDEWADTTGYDLNLQCSSPNCGLTPVKSVPARVWVKHDSDALYYLFQAHYNSPSGADRTWVSSGLEYWWGVKGSKFINHTWYDVCPGLCFGEGVYDHSQGKNVYDPGSKMFQPPLDCGFGTFSGDSYSFELRMLLRPGRVDHWNLVSNKTYGVQGKDGILFFYLSAQCVPVGTDCGTYGGSPATWDYYQSVTLSLLTASISLASTASNSIAQTKTLPSNSSMTTITPEAVGQIQFGSLWLPIVAIIVLASVVIVVRRRKKTTTTVTERPAKTSAPKLSAEPSIPTGYGELDRMLAGGLPEGYAVAVVSQSYDERDLLIRKIIQSTLASGRPTFYLSSDIARTRDLTTRFGQNFFALSPMAEKIGVRPLQLVQNPGRGGSEQPEHPLKRDH